MNQVNAVKSSTSLVQPFVSNSDGQGPVKAWPVLIVCVGSTSAEIGVNVALRSRAAAKRVPFRIVYLDSTPYAALADRLKSLGFAKNEIEDVMPRSRYFELKDPIQGGLAIEDDINAHWRRILHEERLVQQATRTGSAPVPTENYIR